MIVLNFKNYRIKLKGNKYTKLLITNWYYYFTKFKIIMIINNIHNFHSYGLTKLFLYFLINVLLINFYNSSYFFKQFIQLNYAFVA
jgi:hypothetical protein